MQRMIVIAPVEARQQHFALVDGRIEFPVAVHVGVDDEIRRVGDDDPVVEHRDAQRRHQRRLLHEHARGIGTPVVVGILEHHDAIALRIAILVAPVVHALGDPDATLRVDVDIGGIAQLRRLRPHGHFETRGHGEDLERHEARWLGRLHRHAGHRNQRHAECEQ